MFLSVIFYPTICFQLVLMQSWGTLSVSLLKSYKSTFSRPLNEYLKYSIVLLSLFMHGLKSERLALLKSCLLRMSYEFSISIVNFFLRGTSWHSTYSSTVLGILNKRMPASTL